MQQQQEMITQLDTYLKAIKNIRAKQLEIFSESILQKQTLNEIEIYKNILALYYIEERYALLKKALLLLSDSKKHIWLNVGKNARLNTYAPITQQLQSPADIEKSLGQFWQTLHRELSSLKQKYKTEALWLWICLFSFFLLSLAFFFTAKLVFWYSLPLVMCSIAIPAGIVMLAFLINLINIGLNEALFKNEPPMLFKNKISREFASLEQEFTTEPDEVFTPSKDKLEFCLTLSSIYQAPETNLNVTSNASEANLCISSKKIEIELDETGKPIESKLRFTFKQDPIARSELYTRFNGTNSLFLSSNNTSQKTLKDDVQEEYSQLLTKNQF